MRRKTMVFLLAGLAVTAVTAVNFAGTNTSASVNVTAGSGVTTTAFNTGTPSWAPTTGKAGSITAGDLYKIVSPSAGTDINATLYITNPVELSKAYSYLNVSIAVYGGTSSDNGTTITWDSTPLANSDSLLSLTSGFVNLSLTGSQYYKIRVTGGSFYSLNTSDATNLSPSFTIDIR